MDSIFSFFQSIPEDARKGRFPPFGSVSREFGLRALVLASFLEVFDLTDGQNIFNFLKVPQGMRARADFPPSGSYQGSFGSAELSRHRF